MTSSFGEQISFDRFPRNELFENDKIDEKSQKIKSQEKCYAESLSSD
jgi:hypothetical protein